MTSGIGSSILRDPWNSGNGFKDGEAASAIPNHVTSEAHTSSLEQITEAASPIRNLSHWGIPVPTRFTSARIEETRHSEETRGMCRFEFQVTSTGQNLNAIPRENEEAVTATFVALICKAIRWLWFQAWRSCRMGFPEPRNHSEIAARVRIDSPSKAMSVRQVLRRAVPVETSIFIYSHGWKVFVAETRNRQDAAQLPSRSESRTLQMACLALFGCWFVCVLFLGEKVTASHQLAFIMDVEGNANEADGCGVNV